MAPRGKKTEAETEAPEGATQPAETSTPAGDLPTAPADGGDAAPVGQVDPEAAGAVVGAEMVVTGDDDAGGDDGASVSDPSETDSAQAAASTEAAKEVLGAILDQAKETTAATDEQGSKVPDARWFPVVDPVSLDGQDYDIEDDIALTFAQHESLFKAGVIDLPWVAGVEVF